MSNEALAQLERKRTSHDLSEVKFTSFIIASSNRRARNAAFAIDQSPRIIVIGHSVDVDASYSDQVEVEPGIWLALAQQLNIDWFSD